MNNDYTTIEQADISLENKIYEQVSILFDKGVFEFYTVSLLHSRLNNKEEQEYRYSLIINVKDIDTIIKNAGFSTEIRKYIVRSKKDIEYNVIFKSGDKEFCQSLLAIGRESIDRYKNLLPLEQKMLTESSLYIAEKYIAIEG